MSPGKTNPTMRYDLQIIASWIEPKSRILDLGCGSGDLLKFLINHRQVKGSGIEHDESKVAECIEKGLSVLQGDINEELLDYPENTFDYVILSQTLQQVYEPDTLIRAMMRVGKRELSVFRISATGEFGRNCFSKDMPPSRDNCHMNGMTHPIFG